MPLVKELLKTLLSSRLHRVLRPRGVAGAVGVALVVSAGCGGEDSPPAAGPEPTPVPELADLDLGLEKAQPTPKPKPKPKPKRAADAKPKAKRAAPPAAAPSPAAEVGVPGDPPATPSAVAAEPAAPGAASPQPIPEASPDPAPAGVEPAADGADLAEQAQADAPLDSTTEPEPASGEEPGEDGLAASEQDPGATDAGEGALPPASDGAATVDDGGEPLAALPSVKTAGAGYSRAELDALRAEAAKGGLQTNQINHLRDCPPGDPGYLDAMDVLVSHYEARRQSSEHCSVVDTVVGQSRYRYDPEWSLEAAKCHLRGKRWQKAMEAAETTIANQMEMATSNRAARVLLAHQTKARAATGRYDADAKANAVSRDSYRVAAIDAWTAAKSYATAIGNSSAAAAADTEIQDLEARQGSF